MIDTTELEADIQARINALAGTESVEELFSLTSALRALTSKSYVSVPTYADLPNLTTKPLPSGSLIFVQQLNILMMSVGNQWKGVDGRTYTPPMYIAYAWGSNSVGQLGDNTTSNRSSPVSVVGGITNWSQISKGFSHTLGVTSTGIAYAWGAGSKGRLGDNNTSNRSSPVTVVGGIANWIQLSAGVDHSLGLTSTGIAYAWGGNYYGQLGDNTNSSRLSPVTVVGGIANWKQLSTGSAHSLGLTSTGIVYSWGQNRYGKLGDNTTSDKSSPVTVVGGITNWSLLSDGYFNLGLTSSGIAYAWGPNGYGQLGDNTTTARSSPVTIVGGIANWSQLSAGYDHGLGITSTGIAYGWGRNNRGQIGDGTISTYLSPVTVVGGITNWSKLSAGSSHSLGFTSTGSLYVWGLNTSGQLGDGTTVSKRSPVTVVGGVTRWIQISCDDQGAQSFGITVV